jgi:hypothetical protein
MKTEIYESEWGLEIKLIPETLKESNQLLRYCRNAKKVPPVVYYSIERDEPSAHISLEKVSRKNQKISIKNDKS